MKKILLSLGIIVLVVAGVSGATVAYFSSTATITGGTFTSGSLALKIDQNPSPGTYTWVSGFNYSTVPFINLYPGYTHQQVIDLKNEGTIDGNATIDLNRTSGWNDLAGVLNFRIYYDGDHDGSFVDTGLNGTVDQYAGPYTLGLISGSPDDGSGTGKIASVKIVWSVPTTAGNEIQGDSVIINAVFGLEQVR